MARNRPGWVGLQAARVRSTRVLQNMPADRANIIVRRLGLLFLILGCLVPRVAAHPVPFSYLDLRLSGGQIQGRLVTHIVDLGHDLDLTPESLLDPGVAQSKRDEITRLVSTRLFLVADGQPLQLELLEIEPLPDRQAVAIDLGIEGGTALPSLLRIKCDLFPYDPQHQTFLNIYEDGALTSQAILGQGNQTFDYNTGARLTWTAVIRRFVPAGIYHIFTGPDHVLFIIGLLLLGGSLPRLLSIVTAFTVAHSVTLTLAALGLVNPPARLIEPAIAL